MSTNNKNLLSEEIKKGVLYLNAGLILIIVITGAIYLFSLGGTSHMGYAFTQKELEYTELKNTNENLKLEVLRASSYNEIRNNNPLLSSMEEAKPEFYETRLDRLSKK